MLERITTENIKEKIIQADKKSVLIFKSEFCPHCRKMTSLIEDLKKDFGDKISFGYVDIAQDADLAIKYGVTGVPTTIVFEKGGVKDTIIGFQPKDKVIVSLG